MAIWESCRSVQTLFPETDQSLKSQKSYEFDLETFISEIVFNFGG